MYNCLREPLTAEHVLVAEGAISQSRYTRKPSCWDDLLPRQFKHDRSGDYFIGTLVAVVSACLHAATWLRFVPRICPNGPLSSGCFQKEAATRKRLDVMHQCYRTSLWFSEMAGQGVPLCCAHDGGTARAGSHHLNPQKSLSGHPPFGDPAFPGYLWHARS